MLVLAIVTLMVVVLVALAFIAKGSEKWQELGFKILELSVQMLLVTVLGGVLVQAYIKWRSRASSINEFRKTTAEAVIREYSAAKKVRRLIRASCVQGLGGSEIDPWTDIPLSAYDQHMSSIIDAQLALELLKRRLILLGAAFDGAAGLSQNAKLMEKYLGKIIGEYERHRNRGPKLDPIPLRELPRLLAFIAGKPGKNKASDFNDFRVPFDDLLELLETEGIWIAI
jgi:hypothetical protein